ncbi:MAG: hypothetical protein ABIT01_10365 [Thermoanaerobaculia bacterium]
MNRFVSLGVLALSLCAGLARAQDVVVYTEALQPGFEDYSYSNNAGDLDFVSTTQAHTGTKSIAFRGNTSFNALSIHSTSVYTTAQYPTIHFWIHGGTTGGQQLQIALENGGAGLVASGSLNSYISGSSIAANSWREVTVAIGQAPLSYAGSFDRITLQTGVGTAQPFLYVDDISLVPGVVPPAANVIQIEQNVSIDPGFASFLSDRFTWRDAADRPRVAVLTHNDNPAIGPTTGYPNHGGSLREFRYQLPADNVTRVANLTTYGNGGYGGFGYVVSHSNNLGNCVNPDDSPLGYGTAGLYERVFEGRHHVIFRFTQNYPRNCSSPPATARTIPVTIDWVFSTGRDNPLWAITYDMSGITANVLDDDSRAPYGELNIDGQGAQDIDGVAWGDRYKFTSTSAPVTLNSAWTYTTPNTVPYVKEWIAGPITGSHTRDATMGIVQTQTMSQQDAAGGRIGGYHDITPFWNKTSAQGSASPGSGYLMPWQDDWPYQANAFNLGTAAPPTGSNNNSRLTWRTQYGFLGQTFYTLHDPNDGSAPGWPKKSYSTYIVLGTHTTLPVEAQVTQVETVQSLSLSATLGLVVANGPAGINRADSITYDPVGYNHVYGALAFAASTNNLTANIGVGTGTLKKPLVIVGNYTGAYPTVKLASVTLVADVDYFASLRASANELWITLNRDLTGATNSLEIIGSGAAPPTITPSGPTTFCAGGSVTLNSSSGTGYQWNLDGNPIGGATAQAYLAAATGSYTVVVTGGANPGTSAATVVTVNPIPATPVISAPAGTTAGATGLVASAVSHAGSTYSWGITNGTITGGQTTNQITFTAGAVGTVALSVIETTAGCPSAQANTSLPVSAAIAFTLRTLAPCRVIDTRNATGPDAGAPSIAASATRTIQPVGRCSIPATARALSVNVTITGATASGGVLLYPANFVSAPVASTISFQAGLTRANNALVLLASDGTGFKLVNSSPGALNFILDVNGWFE